MADVRRRPYARLKTPFHPLSVCLWLCLLLSQAVYADDEIVQQQLKLDALRQQIKSITTDIDSVRGQQTSEQARLKKTELAIGNINADLHRLDREAATVRQQLKALAVARAKEQQTIASLQHVLQQELQSAYAAGRQQRIKLLLNQQQPAELSRMLVYQGYIAEARSLRMQEVAAAIARIHDIERQRQTQQTDIERIKASQRAQAVTLQAEQAKRQQLLAGMKRELQDKSGRLDTLQQDEQQIQTLLQELQQALRTLPANANEAVSLKALKGKLAWPVAGNIAQRYGSKQTADGPQSNGVFISTSAGADVQAIAAGRIAFADWLRGFGLLLIIDHGEGYMSLYGQNRSLYRAVGDWVGRGEVVAAAGNSGGQLRNGLYLELRMNGRPFNPTAWFSGQP